MSYSGTFTGVFLSGTDNHLLDCQFKFQVPLLIVNLQQN
jgi:hypothetical protein